MYTNDWALHNKHENAQNLFFYPEKYFNWKLGQIRFVKSTQAPGLPDFSWYNIPKLGKNIQNDHKLYHMATDYIKKP
jgi:hypothetical protein